MSYFGGMMEMIPLSIPDMIHVVTICGMMHKNRVYVGHTKSSGKMINNYFKSKRINLSKNVYFNFNVNRQFQCQKDPILSYFLALYGVAFEIAQTATNILERS